MPMMSFVDYTDIHSNDQTSLSASFLEIDVGILTNPISIIFVDKLDVSLQEESQRPASSLRAVLTSTCRHEN